MINYPNKKTSYNKTVEQTPKTMDLKKSRLGINFEDMINDSNRYYLAKDIAVIHKKPTPIQITKVDYPKRSSAKITEAFYKVPSTTDYNGIYKGKYIDFEAKSCKGKSFTFNNLYQHQIEHLKLIEKHGGISFLIIRFNDFEEVYVVPTNILYEQYQLSFKGGRKSLAYEFVKEKAYLVPTGYAPMIDYLKVIDEIYFKEKRNV